jgi:hypothetical protein
MKTIIKLYTIFTSVLKNKNSVIENDFHPSTESHAEFYQNIINPKIKNIFNL